MAIHTEETVRMSGGFSKEIDKGALPLIFDNLQRFQYQYPVKSTVREVVSNGLDSIREKNVARSILTGLSRVEDHYEQKEGDVYKDSHFNPAYYDLNYLSDENTVVVEYFSGNNAGKDTVRITDHGVGLGDSRLAGYFNLGYSTKRLSRFPLGKFGLGAKSPLSTGSPFYTLTTWHNGMEYAFNIYNQKVESIIPKFDLENNKENIPYTLPGVTDGNGQPIVMYCRQTAHKNGCQIELLVKKHHKQQYIDAVTSQLLYFDNVVLRVYEENGTSNIVPVKANIIYEDEYIVLATNSPYTKPHILLNNVNYGIIDFRELELEDRMGNVGIKVVPDQVSVNPSRESLIWDDVTREAVVNRFNQVLSIAEKTVSEQLSEPDFFKWVKACALVSNSSTAWYKGESDDTMLGRLASIVDLSKVEMQYVLNPKVKYSYRLFAGISNRVVTMTYRKEGSKTLKKVVYDSGARTALANGLPVVLQRTETLSRKNKYLTEVLFKTGFVNILIPDFVPEGRPVTPADVPSTSPFVDEYIKTRKSAHERISDEKYQILLTEARDYIAIVYNYIFASEDVILYEDLEVPDSYKATEAEEEEQEEEQPEEQQKEASMSASERRKINGDTLVHALRVIPNEYEQRRKNKAFEFCAIDVNVSTIDKWENSEIFWGNQNDDALLQMAGLICRPHEIRWKSTINDDDCKRFKSFDAWKAMKYKAPMHYYRLLTAFHENAPVRLFKVSQQNARLYRDFPHVTRFFKIIKNKVLTMSDALIRWNTARIVSKNLPRLAFLNNFQQISPSLEAAYKELYAYAKKYYRDIQSFEGIQGGGTMANPLVEHLDKVQELQLYVRNNPDDKEGISALVTEMFNPDANIEINNGASIDLEVYDKLTALLDWSEPVFTLMNMIGYFRGTYDHNRVLSSEEMDAVQQYFKYRNCQLQQ